MKQNYFGRSLAILAVIFLGAVARADSLTPAFGEEGAEFKLDAADSHKITGWLPKGWVDNSEWAPINATYAKLPAADAPKPEVTAVRITIAEVSSGQLQLTSWAGKQTFKKGVKYAVEGWVRSKEAVSISAGVRQQGDPYEFYAQEDLETGEKWKPFKFAFSLDEDKEAVVMFVIKEVGKVDLADITCSQK